MVLGEVYGQDSQIRNISPVKMSTLNNFENAPIKTENLQIYLVNKLKE